jgi:Neuroendocrine protein 7B2 precursor (Secretogranin V)
MENLILNLHNFIRLFSFVAFSKMMFHIKIALMLTTALMGVSLAYYNDLKEASDAFLLREMLDALAAQDPSDEYSDDDPLQNQRFSDILSRAQKDQTERLMDYDSILERTNPHPSLRDEEHMQHSSLWGYQFMSGGAGEGEN